jgi:3-isopropylmalate/(R)-2-methylmalate dehydratase small subunit
MVLTGKAWKFGDDISTDLIAPGRLFHLRSDLPELAKHVMEDAREGFYKKISRGDFLVAGENFGLGSSREHAPTILKIAGLNAVLAKSFARIFYRNCINVGLPAIVCETDRIEEGDTLEVDLQEGKVRDVTQGFELTFPPLPPLMNRILIEGGLVSYIQKYGELRRVEE